MGSLSKMIDFLEDTGKDVTEIREKLEEFQKYFNDNFNNVTKVRTREITWLQDQFFEDITRFPDAVQHSYKQKLPEAEKSFEEQLVNLNKEKKKLSSSMTLHDSKREMTIKSIKGNNKKLDNREEKLKVKVAAFEEDLRAYNKRIDELNSGFGFLINFFKMRAIQKEKDRITEKRDELIDAIEELRGKWQEELEKMEVKDISMQEQWLEEKAELAMAEEKLNILTRDRELLIKRSAFMNTLKELTGKEDYVQKAVQEKPKSCRRCKSPNKENNFFCRFCGEPFVEDRTDVAGSLGELGELNAAFESLQTGIRQSVSFIALMKGLMKGIDVFTKSVKDVKSSQDQYSTLSKLKINVPDASSSFAGKIHDINDTFKVKFKRLHPADFAADFKQHEERIFTDKKIEGFFTAMGDELDRTTKEQW